MARSYFKFSTQSKKRIRQAVRDIEAAGGQFKVCAYSKDWGSPDSEALVDAEVLIRDYIDEVESPYMAVEWCGDGFAAGISLVKRSDGSHDNVIIWGIPLDFVKRFQPK